MDRLRPKYVTFDTHGTLINFQMAEAARDLYGHLLDAPRMDEFIRNFQGYRFDEVMQGGKPYADVVHNALEQACRRNGLAFRAEDALMVYTRIPTWGPHTQVFAKLKTLLRKAEERTVETVWKRIGTLLDCFQPSECAAYLRNSGYAST